MLLKIIILFLGGMAVIAMIGNWLFPGALSKRRAARAKPPAKPAVCKTCGGYVLGKGGCDRCTPAGRKG